MYNVSMRSKVPLYTYNPTKMVKNPQPQGLLANFTGKSLGHSVEEE